VEPRHEVRGRDDRAAPFLGLDPGVGGSADDPDPAVEEALAGRDDVAVRPRALEDEAGIGPRRLLADVRRRGRRADLLVGVRDEDQVAEGKLAEHVADRCDRVQAGQQARLHVGHAGSAGHAVLDRERPLGRGPGIEHGVHVPDQQQVRSAAAGPRSDDRVAERGVRADLDRCAELPHPGRHPPADLVDARFRVAPAVDVDQPFEVGQEVGQGRPDLGLDPGQLVRRRSGFDHVRQSSGGRRAPGIVILGGPCA
jgi:hypothetical protein